MHTLQFRNLIFQIFWLLIYFSSHDAMAACKLLTPEEVEAKNIAAAQAALADAQPVDSDWGPIPNVIKKKLDEVIGDVTEDRTLNRLIDQNRGLKSPPHWSRDTNFPRPGETDPVRQLKINGTAIDYNQISDSSKAVGHHEPLYFGKVIRVSADGGESSEEIMRKAFNKTRSQVIRMFQIGRGKNPHSSPPPHSDIHLHQDTTKDAPSMFIQTTKAWNVGQTYGTTGTPPVDDPESIRMGIVYFIDPHAVEAIDIGPARRELNFPAHKFDNEQEVILYQQLAADRIIGAMVYEKNDAGQQQAIGFVQNPNWVSRYPLVDDAVN